jgi:hypothetical protein
VQGSSTSPSCQSSPPITSARTYSKEGSPFSANARWVREFENERMIELDVLAPSHSYQFGAPPPAARRRPHP